MIKATELKSTEKPGIRYRGDMAATLTLGVVKELIERCNEENYGLPIQIRADQIKQGNLLRATIEDCLIVTNTQHSGDYFKYCLTLRKQGKMATLAFQYYGMSVLTGKANETEERKKSGTFSGFLLNKAFGVNQAELDAEYEYYEMLDNLLAEAMG